MSDVQMEGRAESEKAKKQGFIDRLTPRQMIGLAVVGAVAVGTAPAVSAAVGVGAASSAALVAGGMALAVVVRGGLSKIRQLAETVAENARLREQVQTLQDTPSKVGELEQKLNATTVSLANARADISHLVSDNRELTAQNRELKTQVSDIRADAMKYRNEAVNLEAQLNQSRSALPAEDTPEPSAAAVTYQGMRP